MQRETAGQEGVRILLIEDDPSYADLVCHYLRSIAWADAYVEVAGTLADALARLGASEFELVISDLNLPDSAGDRTLPALAAVCTQPIIAITADEESGVRDRAVAHGAYEFIAKKALSRAVLERHVRLAVMQAGALRSLRDSETRFRRLTDLSSDWYWEQDTEYRFLRVEGREVAGGSRVLRQALIGKRRWETGLEVEGGWEEHRALLEARAAFHDVLMWRRRDDGGNRYMIVSGEPFFDSRGAFCGYRGVGRDATTEKRAEQLLRLEHHIARELSAAEDAEQGIRAVLTAICESEDWECGRYFAFDEAADLLRFSDGLARDPGIQPFVERSRGLTFRFGEGLAGRILVDGQPIWSSDSSADPRVQARGLSAEFGINGAFAFAVVSGGRPIGVLSFSTRRLRLPDERLLRATGVIGAHVGQFLRRKRTEEALRDSESRFRDLTEISSDWYWEQDEHLRFVQDSEDREAAGMRPSSYVGLTRWEAHPEALPPAQWAAHRHLLESRQPFQEFEYERRSADGVSRWVSISGRPLFDADGRFRGYRGVGRDITERKRQERLLSLEHKVTTLLSESRTVEETIAAVLVAICESERWENGRYFELDEKRQRMRLAQGWASTEAMARFNRDAEGLELRNGEGLVGAAWAAGEVLWVPDVDRDPRTAQKGLARHAGVHGAVVFPLTFEGSTVGAMSFSSAIVREPDARLEQTVRVIGAQVGRFLRHKADERARRGSEERFRQMTQLSSDWYWEQDAEFRFKRFEGDGAAGFESPPDISLGKRRWELGYEIISGETWLEHQRTLEAHLPFRDLEFARYDAAGRVVAAARTSGEPVFAPDGAFTGYRGVARDITDRKIAEERIRYLAHHDALTGLPNRLLFQDRVGQAIAQAHRARTQVAVLFIDLDHFKHINDSLGHQVGDRLLQAAAERLKRCLREGDSVCRLGGDEFVISLPSLGDVRDAGLVAGKVLETLSLPFDLEGRELHVGASIGISVAPDDGEDATSLMRAADTAMYHAKEKGRGNYQYFTAALNDAAQQRLALASQLRQALARGEFALHYQPQVHLESDRVISVEALLRWQRPGEAPVSCGDFISVAEETGLILPLGEWALREACSQLARWRKDGYADLQMAVNLSARQLYQSSFQDVVARVLESTGLPASALELEITESLLMLPSPENLRTLQQLAAMGVRLSVDDFGMGYSSLAYLQRFPLHALKIDRSFVSGIGVDSSHTAIVTAIVAMAQSLRLKVLAEGVETAEQVAFLRGRGCDGAQGYYYGRPMTAEAFQAFLRQSGEAPVPLASG